MLIGGFDVEGRGMRVCAVAVSAGLRDVQAVVRVVVEQQCFGSID